MSSEVQPSTESDGTVRVIAPAADDLIRDLREHAVRADPDNRYGFNSAEIWEYRLREFGYLQLFSDWYRTVWEPTTSPGESA